MTLVLPCSSLPVSSEASHWSNSDQTQKTSACRGSALLPLRGELGGARNRQMYPCLKRMHCLPEIQIY